MNFLTKQFLPQKSTVKKLAKNIGQTTCCREKGKHNLTKMSWIATMDIGYIWIYLQGKICRQFSLLIWISFVGQFVHPRGG